MTPHPGLQKVRWRDPIELPSDLALTMWQGPYEGLPLGVYRLYRDRSGAIRIDDLVGRQFNESVAGDAGQIALTHCVPDCGYGEGIKDSRPAALWLSSDGGITWSSGPPMVARERLVGFSDGKLLIGGGTWSNGQPVSRTYRWADGSALIPPISLPVDRRAPNSSAWWYTDPQIFASNELGWWTGANGAYLRTDGSPFFQLGGESSIGSTLPNNQTGVTAVQWQGSGLGGTSHVLSIVDSAGTVLRSFEVETFLRFGAWMSPNVFLGSMNPPWEVVPHMTAKITNHTPVLFDISTGEVTPVVFPFYPGGYALPIGAPIVFAAAPGPFARVVNTHSCLNIRAAPSATAAVRACAADSVLLTDLGETRDGWARVRTPAGVEGWASEEFLAR
jgi:hypothetical protein